jgi:predicted nucleotidyltransferase component of viral defense system
MAEFYFSVLIPRQIKLLKKLKFLKKYGFYLAGGTALALQIGHRTSIDFDFYTEKKFDSQKLYKLLEKKLKRVTLLGKDEDTLLVRIQNVSASFFRYPYPLIFPPIQRKDFPPLASKEDIAAMKIIAISERGTKRDFIDIYFLLKEFSLEKILNWVKKKYPNFNIYIALRALTYFADAEEKQKRRLYLTYSVSWSKIKKFLIEEVKKYQEKWLR